MRVWWRSVRARVRTAKWDTPPTPPPPLSPPCSQFQKAFPRVLVKRSVLFHDDIVRDVKLCVHLHNARTRLMGYNQLTTSYVALINDRFKELLACKGAEEYAAKAAAIVEKEGQLF